MTTGSDAESAGRWIDPNRLAEITLDAVNCQPASARGELLDAMQAGTTEVWAPPGDDWVSVIVDGREVARVHRTRLFRRDETN